MRRTRKRASPKKAASKGAGPRRRPATPTVKRKTGGETAPAEDLQTKLLYLQSDFENFRRRTERERTELASRAVEGTVRRLLDVLDGFDSALRSAGPGTDPAAVRTGLEMLQRQMVTALGSVGLERIPSHGALFDPSVHEALDQTSDRALPDRTVTMEIRAGYRLQGKVLRAAGVRVNVHPGSASEASAVGGAAAPPAEPAASADPEPGPDPADQDPPSAGTQQEAGTHAEDRGN